MSTIKPEIIAQVNQLMHEGFELPMEKLVPTATLFDELGLDSLDAIDMLVYLEERLAIKVDVERLKNIRTLQDIYVLAQDLAATAKTDTASATTSDTTPDAKN